MQPSSPRDPGRSTSRSRLAITDPDGDEIELNADVLGVDQRSDPALIIAPVPPLRLRNIGAAGGASL